MHAWLLAYYYYSGWDGTLWLPTSKQQAAGKEGSILLALHLISGESPGLQADENSRRPSFLRLRALLCSLRDFLPLELQDWMELDKRGKRLKKRNG